MLDSSPARHSGESRNPATLTAAQEPKQEETLDSGFRRNDEQKSTPVFKRKLSYKDARELEQLPARIETLESEIAARTQAMHDPAFFRQDSAAITAANQAMAALQAELDDAYARWQALEA